MRLLSLSWYCPLSAAAMLMWPAALPCSSREEEEEEGDEEAAAAMLRPACMLALSVDWLMSRPSEDEDESAVGCVLSALACSSRLPYWMRGRSSFAASVCRSCSSSSMPASTSSSSSSS